VLITERDGRLRVIRNGELLSESISGTPDVYFAGQGGLLDVMLDANFVNNQTLYLSYATGDRRANSTQLMSATLDGMTLKNQRILFTASPMKSTAHHYAGRIAQMEDGSVLLAVGDGFDYREQAQTLDNHFGKIIRINQDGSAHKDNPFLNTDKAKADIWSYGHRNMQALTVVNGVVYENEHGPKGGDEVNIIEPGLNYGWPVITYGIDYNGAQITPFTEYEGMQQPKVNWTPSIAPSSMTYHKGHLYVTSLAEKSVRKLSIDGNKITDNGIVFKQLKTRMRDIASAPDGHLYILTDGGNAKLLKLSDNE
jgi:glucose/arabinose dehydrogenase